MNQSRPTIADYQPLVKALAAKYRRRGGEMDDLIQEGMIGLLEALKRYDADKGAAFSTYSTYWIEKKMRENLARKWRDPCTAIEDQDQIEAPPAMPEASQTGFDPAWLKLLAPLESQVIALDFIEHKTLVQIADDLALSRARVRQIKKKALRKIRINQSGNGLSKETDGC